MNKKLVLKFIILFFFIIATHAPTVLAARFPIPVTVVDTLDFGLSTPGTNGGTVSFPADGNISATGDVILLGGGQKGQVTIQAVQGRRILVRVRRSRVKHTSTNAKMRFKGSCIGPGGVIGIRKCTFRATGGIDVVTIGAVLEVGSNVNQDGGHYSGTTEVTATSN
jgi:hypothetical protein